MGHLLSKKLGKVPTNPASNRYKVKLVVKKLLIAGTLNDLKQQIVIHCCDLLI